MGGEQTAGVTITFDEKKHEYRVNGNVVPSVTQIIEAVGLSDYKEIAALNAKSQKAVDFAAYRGTAVHLACELYDRGDLNEESVDPQIRGYFEAWKKFRADRPGELLGIEELVYNKSAGYAGRLDRRIRFFNQYNEYAETIVDIKTGRGRLRNHSLQVYAYGCCFDYPVFRLVVYLQDDGQYVLKSPTSEMVIEDRADWSACLNMYNTLRRYGLV